jgi:hypothetical protein
MARKKEKNWGGSREAYWGGSREAYWLRLRQKLSSDFPANAPTGTIAGEVNHWIFLSMIQVLDCVVQPFLWVMTIRKRQRVRDAMGRPGVGCGSIVATLGH